MQPPEDFDGEDFSEDAAEEVQHRPAQIDIETEMDAIMQTHQTGNDPPEQRLQS